jgi:hypothetical protein
MATNCGLSTGRAEPQRLSQLDLQPRPQFLLEKHSSTRPASSLACSIIRLGSRIIHPIRRPLTTALEGPDRLSTTVEDPTPELFKVRT